MSSLTPGVAGEAPKQCIDPVTSVGKCEGLQPCHLFSKNSGIPSFTSSSSPAPCPPKPRFAFGALPSAPPLLPCIGGCQGFQNISKEASGKGLACKNRSRVVLSSPHYWTGKSCTVTSRLAEQVKIRVETSPTGFSTIQLHNNLWESGCGANNILSAPHCGADNF